MSSVLLRLSGFLAFITGQPRQSSRNGLVDRLMMVIQSVSHIALVVVLGFLVTYAVTAYTRSWVDDAKVRHAIASMIEMPAQSAEAEIINSELSGSLRMGVDPRSDHGVSVIVWIGEGDQPVPQHDPCDPNVGTPPDSSDAEPPADAICLYRPRPVFPGLPWLSDFVAFEFPGSAYSIPHLAIAAATSVNPEIRFTQARSTTVRQRIEGLIGQDIFLPSSKEVLWGRRVNGPIQAVTIWLAASALIMLLLAWLNSCVQNSIVKRTRRVRFDECDPLPVLAAIDPGPGMGQDIVLIDANGVSPPAPDEEFADTVTVSESRPRSFVDDQVSETPMRLYRDYPTPWSGELVGTPGLDLSDADATARYFDQVSKIIQAQSAVGGVSIDPPALRLRRAAARAVANTDDTSILPSFLDAQKDSILAFYDARLSLVRYMLWLIPTVGFIGTIIGVSDALSTTISLQSSSDLVAGLAQSSVSASMGMAFDTTLVALLAAVIVMLAFHLVQGAEERMTVLERDQAETEILELSRAVRKPGSAGDLAQQLILLGVNTQNLVKELGLFQTSGPEVRSLVTTLKQQSDEMKRAMEGLSTMDKGNSWFKRALLPLTVLAVLILVLVAQGVFGTDAQKWIADTFARVTG